MTGPLVTQYDELPDGSVRIRGTKTRVHPNGYKNSSCGFTWMSWKGGEGRNATYRCTLGNEHLKQHHGESISTDDYPDDAQRWRETFGATPRYVVLKRT